LTRSASTRSARSRSLPDHRRPADQPVPPPGTQIVNQHIEVLNRLESLRLTSFDTRSSAQKRGFEREHTKDDPLNIDDDAIRWKVWNEGDTPPAAPDLPPANNVKLVAFDDIRLTPTIGAVKGQFLRWFLYGARSTGDEHKLPNYSTDTDPFALENHAVRAGLDGEAFVDPGAAFVLRMVGTKPLTLGLGVNRLLTVKVYGVRTTLDDRQMPHRFANADAQKIESDGEYLEVYNTADGEPADPTPTLGELQNVGKKIEEIDQQHSQKTTKQDVLNSAQRHTFPKIKTDDDPQNIEDESFRSQTWSGTAPDDPDDPPSNNVKLILRTDVPLTPGTASSPAIYQRIWLYGPKDSGDRLILPNYETADDPSQLESTALRAALDGQPFPEPGGIYQVRGVKTVPVTLGLGINRLLTVKVYGVRTTKQDETLPGTYSETDPLGLDSSAKQTDIYNPETGPIPPVVTPAGQQIAFTHVEFKTPTLVKRIVVFDVLNSEQKRGFPKVETVADAFGLRSSAVRFKFFTHGTAGPAAPDDPPTGNVKIIHTSDHRYSPTKDMRLFVYGTRSSRDEAVLDRVRTVTDASELTSTAFRAFLDGETLIAPGGDYVEREREAIPLTDGLSPSRTLTIVAYGLLTRQQELEYESSEASVSVTEGYTRKNTTVVDWTDTDDALADSLLSDNQNDDTFQQASVRLLTPGKARQTVITNSSDKLVHSARVHGTEDYVRARPLGAPSDWDNVVTASSSFSGIRRPRCTSSNRTRQRGSRRRAGGRSPSSAIGCESASRCAGDGRNVVESNIGDYLHRCSGRGERRATSTDYPTHSCKYNGPSSSSPARSQWAAGARR
jgi:hypothetical protein